MLAPGVTLVAGTHDMSRTGDERRKAIPDAGYDITVGPGAFLGANCTVIGPCKIGPDAVVAAGAVVVSDVAPGALVAGVPARHVKFVV